MEVSCVRNSWLTRPRSPARCPSSSSSGVRSCKVTTTDSTSPASERMGVALTRVVTEPTSGTWMTIGSARTVSPVLSACARGNSSRPISRPSPRRKVRLSNSCSPPSSGAGRSPRIRLDSQLIDTGRPVPASKTMMPTGPVLIRVSKSARASFPRDRRFR